MSSIESKATFQEEWLTSKLYKDWIIQGKNKNYAKCVLCLKDIDVSTMGSAALDSHAKRAKHKVKKIKDRSTISDLFFKKPNQTPVEQQHLRNSNNRQHHLAKRWIVTF